MRTRYSSKIDKVYIEESDKDFYRGNDSKVALGDWFVRLPIVGGRYLGVDANLALEEPVELVRDLENPVDPNAIKVLYRGHHIGWIPVDRTYLFSGSRLNGISVFSGKSHHIYLIHGD